MTLTEYSGQENPTRGNKVILNSNEFKMFGTVKVGQDKLTSIVINKFPQYNYVLKNGTGYLYTTDDDGNPRKISTFFINSIKFQKA